MTNETKHTATPRPWRVLETKSIYGEYNGTDQMIAAVFPELGQTDHREAEANAAHIVKCVNAHDDLVSALKQIANGEGYYGAQAKEYKDIARSALKKASE